MKAKQGFEYSIMKDSHMYYFLQSVPKVRELLGTGLYKLQADCLLEVATKQKVKLDPYVADALKQTPLVGRDQNQQEQLIAALMQSQKFRAFEEERQRLRRMRQNGSESRVRRQTGGEIKGLKEFLSHHHPP